MTKANSIAKPTFLWQGVFILLPVTVLAVVGLVSLRLDERAAETEARGRAAGNAPALARAMRGPVEDELNRFLTVQADWMNGLRLAGQSATNGAFPDAYTRAEIDKWERDYPGLRLADLVSPRGGVLADGRRLQPPDLAVVPSPPKWFLELSPEQKAHWDHFRSATDPAEIKAARQTLVADELSMDARWAFTYATLPPEEAIVRSGSVVAESGISFRAIACYRLLTATNAVLSDSLLTAIWREATENPGFIAPKLIELAENLANTDATVREKVSRIRRYREGQARARAWMDTIQLPAEVTGRPALLPLMRWTTGPAAKALAFLRPRSFENPGDDFKGAPQTPPTPRMSIPLTPKSVGPGYSVSLVPRAVIEAVFRKALTENNLLVPGFARAVVMIGHEPVTTRGAADAPNADAKLGTAVQEFGRDTDLESGTFELALYLTSREQMLAPEQRRARIFGALILGAVLAALAGWLAAWRAFHRQLHLNDLKSNFVSGVSHELRAPIASVRLLAENLASGKVSEPDKLREYFHFIVQECRRLSSLIENVLDFSRIEQGRKQYDFEPTDLGALTQTTVKLMEPYAAEKGVRLEIASQSSAPAGVELSMDGRAIQQALVNLIDNAIKHSAKGESVIVGLEIEPAARIVRLHVSDHGPGIPAAERERIFERFYRLGSELRRETRGVGIGLSIVKHIVEAHGGRVVVISEPGKGSRFTLELPPGERK